MKRSQRGITLLESLVALLILSIGLLGTAHLMATGLKQSNGSFARTQATYIAESIAERMRANPDAIANQYYDGFDSNTALTTADCTSPITPYCQDDGTTAPTSGTCNSEQLADFDMYQATCGNGNNGARGLLPGGLVRINCDAAPCTATSTYTIGVSWNETERDNGDTDTTKTKRIQHRILP